MAAVWCCIIPLRKEFDSGLLVWGPVEGDKLLSLIHVYSLLSNKFSGYFFFSSLLCSIIIWVEILFL